MAPSPDPTPATGAQALPATAGAAAGPPSHRRPAGTSQATAGWLIWLPLTASSMLLVLFAVVVNRQQAQAERIGELIDRVQALEHSRTLERTAVLEQQLRSMLGRLQDVESKGQGQEQLARQLQTLQQELQQLRASRLTGPELPEPAPLQPEQRRPPGSPRLVTPLTP